MANRLTNVGVRAVLGKITAGTPTNVTGATNATPVVVTSTAHGLSTGDKVAIAAVGGNTAANGVFSVTVVNANSFSLDGSVGNGSYTSGGTVTRIYSALTADDIDAVQDALARVRHAKTDTINAALAGLTTL